MEVSPRLRSYFGNARRENSWNFLFRILFLKFEEMLHWWAGGVRVCWFKPQIHYRSVSMAVISVIFESFSKAEISFWKRKTRKCWKLKFSFFEFLGSNSKQYWAGGLVKNDVMVLSPKYSLEAYPRLWYRIVSSMWYIFEFFLFWNSYVRIRSIIEVWRE